MQTRKVPAMRTRIYTREGKNRRNRGGGQKMKTAEKLTKPQSPCTVFYHTLYTYSIITIFKCQVTGKEQKTCR